MRYGGKGFMLQYVEKNISLLKGGTNYNNIQKLDKYNLDKNNRFALKKAKFCF